MGPEITLICVFILSLIVIKIKRNQFEFALAARIGMSAMLIVTGIAHFVFIKGMVMMLPAFVPFRIFIVYLTGIIELIFAITLLTPKYKVKTAWLLIGFFILIIPANIYAAVHQINLETASNDGDGINYLWYRIPLQIVFIYWVYFSAIKTYTIYE